MSVTSASAATRVACARRLAMLTAVLGGVAVLLAGCGGSDATSGGVSPATFTAAAFRYSNCMRSHGLSNFPDPSMTDHDGQRVAFLATPTSLASSPAFKGANRVCQAILSPDLVTTKNVETQATREQHLLAFARCMRSHGVPGFPDPTTQGQLTQAMLSSVGVDLKAPAVFGAAKTCLPSAGGVITAEEVQRAVNGGE
jgi:hypothetical protein